MTHPKNQSQASKATPETTTSCGGGGGGGRADWSASASSLASGDGGDVVDWSAVEPIAKNVELVRERDKRRASQKKNGEPEGTKKTFCVLVSIL